VKRTFKITRDNRGYLSLWHRLRRIETTHTLQRFIESIADSGIRKATKLIASTEPLPNSTLLTKGEGISFVSWWNGDTEVRLCSEWMRRLFPRAQRVWVVVK